AIVGRFGKWRVAAFILAAVYFSTARLMKSCIPRFALARKLKRDVMPAVSATRECRLTIEQAVALESRCGYPGPLSCQTCDLFAVAKSKTLHVPRDRLIVAPSCVESE